MPGQYVTSSLDEAVEKHPDLKEKLKLLDHVGITWRMTELPCWIPGNICSSNWRTEKLRIIKTLDDLTLELKNHLFINAVYLRLLPRNSSTHEGKRHIKTGTVRLIRAQNDEHTIHPRPFWGNLLWCIWGRMPDHNLVKVPGHNLIPSV